MQNAHKIVLSKPVKGEYIRATIDISGDMLQLSKYTTKQVFHENFEKSQLQPVIDGLFGVEFSQLNAWDGEYEYSSRITKKGKILTSRKKTANQARKTNFAKGSFNRQKNYIISEGADIPALIDMGVFTRDGKVAASMNDKFGQINRFLELLADETNQLPEGAKVNIIDFGCGKSYLTFLVYHYFSVIRKLDSNIVGLDLDEHVVKTCTAAAKKYDYRGLRFFQGDIGKQSVPPLDGWGQSDSFNIVISLHACDIATDHALFNAVKWNADLIYAVPCCQHELKSQMKPQSLAIFNRYGIIKERIASLTTDAIRANLLEACGYKTQIIEFIEMEHTPKNLLIRARCKSGSKNNEALSEVKEVLAAFSLSPTLFELLAN